MALNVGSLPVTGVYTGSTEVKSIYVGADLVWENRETVTITGTTTWEARDNLRAALTDRGFDYTTVTEIPFDLDTSSVTQMVQMFFGFSSLTTVPQMDTSNVTTMNGMFYDCSSLTTVPQMDTSNVTTMSSMFYGCSSLTTVPQMDTSKATDMTSMFSDCSSLTTVPQMDTSNVTTMSTMFQRCSTLAYLPDLNYQGRAVDPLGRGLESLKSAAFVGMGEGYGYKITLWANWTAFDVAGANRFMTALGRPEVNSSLRLPVTAQGCNTSIAAGKNWTVTFG